MCQALAASWFQDAGRGGGCLTGTAITVQQTQEKRGWRWLGWAYRGECSSRLELSVVLTV